MKKFTAGQAKVLTLAAVGLVTMASSLELLISAHAQLSPRYKPGSIFRPQESVSSLLSSIFVTNNKDSGPGSLRDAINQANAAKQTRTIRFQPPQNSLLVISPLSPLPPITAEKITIEGSAIDGSIVDLGQNTPSQTLYPYKGPTVWLEGGKAGSDANGLMLQGRNCTVRGLVIEGFGDSQIWVNGGNGNTITGCYLGTSPALPFSGGPYDWIWKLGNLANGDEKAGNNGSGGNTSVGSAGVKTRRGGLLSKLPNRLFNQSKVALRLFNHGAVYVSGGARNTVIGGIGTGNVIANGVEKAAGLDKGDGISVVDGATTGTTIRGNSIYLTGGQSINLNPNTQSVPVITSIGAGGQVQVRGTFDGKANLKFALDFYSDSQFIGTTDVMTNAQGKTKFNVRLDISNQPNLSVSATATNLQTGDTSEFSPAKAIGGYIISGRIVNSGFVGGTTFNNVILTLSQGNVVIATTRNITHYSNPNTGQLAGGDFYFYHIAPGDYTLTASRDDLILNPPSRQITIGLANVVNMDFVGTYR
ncbi:hypothetical protein IAD21_02542 [Abditibacteriota bacterium]|nr:hypothetical protein IAD21_02542 [Abditibacteriota bacterium]